MAKEILLRYRYVSGIVLANTRNVFVDGVYNISAVIVFRKVLDVFDRSGVLIVVIVSEDVLDAKMLEPV